MKKNPSLIGLIIALVAVILSFGIYFLFLKKQNEYLVDNASSATYYFKLNNNPENIISAGQTVKVDLKTGQNSIQVYNDAKKLLYDSTFTVSKPRGLINIAHQDYYINTQYYGYNLNKDSLYAAHQLKVDGGILHADAKKMSKLYDESFYYNVNEKYDKLIKNIQKVESRSKIFRKQDFLIYYKENFKD